MSTPEIRNLPVRAFQWDLARQVERLEVLKRLLPRYAAWGYQELYLHLEDAVHYPSLPGIGRDDAYSYEQLGELVLDAARCNVRVVPIVNLLGHTQYLIKHPDLRDLNELRGERGHPLAQGQICPLHPRTGEVAEKLLRDLAPYCSAGKVHVGLDESFQLGQCPRCREEVARIGVGAHFAGHVRRLHARCEALGLQLGMWADMLYFTPEAIPLLPAGITAYDWYYYPFARQPRVELFNFAERDLATPLKKQGIRYYGCPMNGAFRHEPLPVFGDRLTNLRSWWRRCREVAADGFLVTSWEAYRLAFEAPVVVDAAAASLWLAPESDDPTTMLARGLERVFRTEAARPLARRLLLADAHAFAGYARWQINDRWDVFAGTESFKPYEADLRFFARLAGTAMPAPLAASVAFRRYLAARDVFVRRAAREVFRWRRLLARGDRELVTQYVTSSMGAAAEFAGELRKGRQAARAMWSRTRDPRTPGQNGLMLQADEQRLAKWRTWLKRAAAQPELVADATPVCGVWQLQFWVHNSSPAVQKVVVEQQFPDGGWRELASRYTIEFRAEAARPRTKLRREFTVPVPAESWSAGDLARDKMRGEVAAPPVFRPLRIAVRGVGQVVVSHVALTNGVETKRAAGFRTRHELGVPAPTRGLPVVDWAANRGELALRFPTNGKAE
jgi:hypothetical protein